MLTRIKNWLRPHSPVIVSVPYSVPCPCGRTVSGDRRSTYQIVLCPDCQSKLFVLPQSPYPPVASLSSSQISQALAANSSAQTQPRSSPATVAVWSALAVPVVVIFTVMLLVLLLVIRPWQWGLPGGSQTALTPSEARRQFEQLQEKAGAAVSRGHFRLAVEFFDSMRKIQRQAASNQNEQKELQRRRKEIALYADLCTESIEEVLRHAMQMPNDAWQPEFAGRYRGKALIFDCELRRGDNDRVVCSYVLHVEGEEARLELKELDLFHGRSLPEPQRFFFGARLQSVQRTAPGLWGVRFQKDSGVLLTDPAALAAACSALDTAEVRDALANQQHKNKP